MDQTTSENLLQQDLETALTGLLKLIKALRFYPAEHPALADMAEETCRIFQPLLGRHEPRPYHVTRDGFDLDNNRVAPKNSRLQEFARQLVERRVRYLLFLPELVDRELVIFAQQLARPAAELLKNGGLPETLKELGIRSIWINETSVEEVFRQLQEEPSDPADELTTEAETEAGQPESLPEVDDDALIARLRELLELLKEPLEDDEYNHLLSEVQQKAPVFLHRSGVSGGLALFGLLQGHQRDETRSESQRKAAESCIDQLLQPDISDLLINAVADQKLKTSLQRALARLLIALAMKIAPQLLQRLYAERDAILRRRFAGILAHMGEPLFPLLEDSLHDPKWYVVRNVVYILGETRLEAALSLLKPTLHHPEPRVRRALIRALSSIGSESVIPLLIQLCHDPSAELRRPAVIALGGLADPQAIPPLLEQLKEPDLLGKQTELKVDIIRALAAIKSPQALTPLLELAQKPNLLRLKHLETLRAEAIIAIGQLGDAQLIPLLDQLPNRNRSPVSMALKHATAQLRKQNHAP